MSIQSELTRLTNAKAAIKMAIEGKGVTVPDATLLDGMAALIEGIKTEKVITGTFTVESNVGSYNFDYKPQSVDEWPLWLIIIAEKETTLYSNFKGIWAIQNIYSNVSINRHGWFSCNYSERLYGCIGSTGSEKYYTPYTAINNIAATTVVTANPNMINSEFIAGVTYRYYMGVG